MSSYFPPYEKSPFTPDWNMMERSLGFKERRYIEELRILTRSTALDCIIDDKFERIIYLIKKGNMGLAIGKNGDNIRKLSSILGKRIEMVEYDEDEQTFIANMFKPAELLSITITPEQISIVAKDNNNRGLAIGKNGATIDKAKILVKRFFNIDDIEIQ